MTGKRELTELKIDADAVVDMTDPEDVEMLQDTILAAVNEALRKAESEMSGTMAKLTGGMNFGF